LVKGDPDQRRRYLDDLLVSLRPRYAGVRADYERVLRQRTALLKSAKARGGVPVEALQVWDDHLANAGATLLSGRLRLVAAIRPYLAESYSAVSGTERDTDLRYRMSAASGADGSAGGAAQPEAEDPDPDPEKLALALRDALVVRRRAELERAVCLVGPHRDDLELRIGGLPVMVSPGRLLSRSASLAISCCGARARIQCSCWTTCSPSWTLVAGIGWPRWLPVRSRSSSPPRSPPTYPLAWPERGSTLQTG